MKPRRGVDLLPTISETHEEEERESGGPAHSTDEYLDSIKELSQAAGYPLHGPMRGQRCWGARRHAAPRCPPGAPPTPPAIHPPCAAFHAPWAPVGDARRPDCAASTRSAAPDPLDCLFGRAQFAGLT